MPTRGAVVISPTIAEIEQTHEVRIEMEKHLISVFEELDTGEVLPPDYFSQ